MYPTGPSFHYSTPGMAFSPPSRPGRPETDEPEPPRKPMRIPLLILFAVILGLIASRLTSCTSVKTTDPNTGVVTESSSLDPAAAVLLGQGLNTWAAIKAAEAQKPATVERKGK